MPIRRSLVLVTVVLVTLVACGSDDATTPDDAGSPEGEEPTGEVATPADEATADALDELIAAAQEEGTVVFLHAPPALEEVVAQQFGEKYGITVEATRVLSTELEQRYSAEAEAGVVSADVVLTTDTGFVESSVENGWMLDLNAAGIPGYPGDFPEEFRRGPTAIPLATYFGIGYNTDLVSEEEAPTEWEDLLDPRWQGQIITPDLNSAIVWMQLWDVLERELGSDFVQGVGEQDLIVIDVSVAALEALGAGEASLLIATPNLIASGADRGAPVAYRQPDLGVEVPFPLGLSADAPHPNAARLFVHWLLSDEGIQAVSEAASLPNIFDESTLPANPVVAERDVSQERQQELLSLLGLS